MADVPVIRPYQAEALDFLVKTQRAAIFDEPGLGKSMQALLAMRDLEPRGRILIVAPGDATGVWKDEAAFWLDEEVGVYSGLKPSIDELDRPHGLVVTNYHRLANVLATTHSWDGIIFDESHILRNRNTDTLFRAVRPYFDRQRYHLDAIPAFFLSGTPIVKAAGDLWPTLHIINRRRWNAYWPFVQGYTNWWVDNFGWHTEGVTNAKALWAELDDVSLRRTVAECQPDLPPIQRQRVPLVMTPRQARAYREIEAQMYADVDDGRGMILTPTALARETRLRQLLVSPRLIGVDDPGAGVLALKEIAHEHNRPLVIFTPFPSAFPYIEADLKTKRPIGLIKQGSDGNARAKEFVTRAKAGEAPLLLVSLQMAKSWSVSRGTHEGYMLGTDWNETTMVQAERRIGRDGQTNTVFSRYLVHEDTHDFDQLDVLAGKKRLADVIIDRKTKRRFRR